MAFAQSILKILVSETKYKNNFENCEWKKKKKKKKKFKKNVYNFYVIFDQGLKGKVFFKSLLTQRE